MITTIKAQSCVVNYINGFSSSSTSVNYNAIIEMTKILLPQSSFKASFLLLLFAFR